MALRNRLNLKVMFPQVSLCIWWDSYLPTHLQPGAPGWASLEEDTG